MALNLEAEQRLSDAGLVEFFDAHETTWLRMARRAYRYTRRNFPNNATIRPDDVAKFLAPVLEVHDPFRDRLKEDKLRGKFWILFFADLILDRAWARIEGDEDEGQDNRRNR
jgi:hypothetical protein